jgi:hypothetical protein
MLGLLAQIIEHALDILPNMLAVLAAALTSVLVVSFFRGETTVFTNFYLVIIFATGTLNPILGVVGGSASLVMAQRKREWDQRELALLYTLVFFALALWVGLIKNPGAIVPGRHGP